MERGGFPTRHYFSKYGMVIGMLFSAAKVKAVLYMIEAHSPEEGEAKGVSLEFFLGDAKHVQSRRVGLHLVEIC